MINIIPPIRGVDVYGGGAYLASRGSRKHNGIDLSCYKGSEILAQGNGVVTKIGFPYNPKDSKKGHLRYLEITERNNYKCRYFYIAPTVSLGDTINESDSIGVSQGLTYIYPGITDHIHYEVFTGSYSNRHYLDPVKYLKGEI